MTTGGDYATGIWARTDGKYSNITIKNSGDITATAKSSANATGIGAEIETYGKNNNITINNSGDITATSAAGYAAGIYAEVDGNHSKNITINNSGDITASRPPAPTGFTHTTTEKTATSPSTTQVISRRRRPQAMLTALAPRSKAMAKTAN